MDKINFNKFSTAVLAHKKTETKIEFLTRSGFGLNAFLISVNIGSLSNEEALCLLHFKIACFFEEWDIDCFQNEESLVFLFKAYFNPVFTSTTKEIFYDSFEKLIQSINYSTNKINEYTKKCNNLYLGIKEIKYSEIDTDGSLQLDKRMLNSSILIQNKDILECFISTEKSLSTSYFIVTKDKYYLIEENIIC